MVSQQALLSGDLSNLNRGVLPFGLRWDELVARQAEIKPTIVDILLRTSAFKFPMS